MTIETDEGEKKQTGYAELWVIEAGTESDQCQEAGTESDQCQVILLLRSDLQKKRAPPKGKMERPIP